MIQCLSCFFHVSAGIGRTGTFIVIDQLIDQIKRFGMSSEIDIQRSIQLIRSQRSGLVQTEAQYKFVYLAVEHYVETLQQRIHAEQKSFKTGREYTNIKYTVNEGASVDGITLPIVAPTTATANRAQNGAIPKSN